MCSLECLRMMQPPDSGQQGAQCAPDWCVAPASLPCAVLTALRALEHPESVALPGYDWRIKLWIVQGTYCWVTLLTVCGPSIICPHPFSRLLGSTQDSEVGGTLSWPWNVVLALVLLLLPTYCGPAGLCFRKHSVQEKDAQFRQCLLSETKWRLADRGWGRGGTLCSETTRYYSLTSVMFLCM